MAESRQSGENVYYIYDKVQTKTHKRHEILREYGYELRKLENAAAKSMSERPFGVDFAEAQRRRARRKRSRTDGRTVRTDGGGYIYRPGKVPGGGYGERVAAREKQPPLKLVIDRVVNMFESVEERAKNDERIAKQRAVMAKKWSDNRHAMVTAMMLVVLTLVIAAAMYKLCFVVKSIDVYGSEAYSQEDIVSASGIAHGDNLYSFKSSAAEADITFRCPRIQSAEISRGIPMNVSINTVDDAGKYSAYIWGELVELSAGLRVLGPISESEAEAAGLTELVLPGVKYSVAGRMIEFTDARDERVVRNILGEIADSAAGQASRINKIDLTDEYNITMTADGIYSLRIGSDSDLSLKMRMFDKTTSSGGLDSGTPASIDLSVVGEASVKYNLH